MKIHNNMKLVLGPPGTGKTTELLRIMEKELSAGTRPDQIAFISFTRKAAYEAKERATKKFNFHENDLLWFRTLHSLVYGCLGLSRDDVFSYRHAVEFGKKIGEYIVMSKSMDSDILDNIASGMSDGSLMMFIDNLSRVKMEDLRETWRKVSDDKVSWTKMSYFSRSYKKYKDTLGLVDFTDMVERWISNGHVPKIKAFILDEAQDFSRIQWEAVKRLIKDSSRVYVAGDDDQSIFQWSGADVKFFIDLEAKKHLVLDYSYRLPQRVWKTAIDISDKIKDRREKKWIHREADGQVKFVRTIDELPMESGEWMVLARNKCFLTEISEFCRTMGLPYESQTDSPLKTEALQVIKWWEKLRKGKSITRDQAREVYSWMKSGAGYKRGCKMLPGSEDGEQVTLERLRDRYGLLTDDIWHQALTKVSEEDREYFIALLKRGESVSRPRIKISTIHSVKGGECDNVVILPDMTKRTFQGYEGDPDSEHRVFYVGATRAKENLYILEPQSDNYYLF